MGKTNPKGILYKSVWFLELNTFYSAWNIFIVHAGHFAFLENKFILIHDAPHSFSIILARHISRLFLESLLFTKALNIAWDGVLWLHLDKEQFSANDAVSAFYYSTNSEYYIRRFVSNGLVYFLEMCYTQMLATYNSKIINCERIFFKKRGIWYLTLFLSGDLIEIYQLVT